MSRQVGVKVVERVDPRTWCYHCAEETEMQGSRLRAVGAVVVREGQCAHCRNGTWRVAGASARER